MSKLKVALGCDPNAESYKKELMEFVRSFGHEVVDYGSGDSIYANVAIEVAKDVVSGKCERGILMCGTGIGVSVAANKVKGAYAACISNIYQAQRAALSNNANIITLGSQVVGIELAKCFIKEYLEQQFDPAGRSGPKVNAITDFEKEHFR